MECNERENLAKALLEAARERELEITADLEVIATEMRMALAGLEYRFKKLADIVGKIGRQREKYPLLRSDEQAAARIQDVLRYTLADETETHAEDIEAALERLGQQGYGYNERVQPENNWRPGPFKGVAVNLTVDGFAFELQFHTHESMKALKDNHPLYEEWRGEGTSDERRKELVRLMSVRSNKVSRPPGIGSVGVVRR